MAKVFKKEVWGMGKRKGKAEERPEGEEVVVSSKREHVPDHSSCRKESVT